MSVFSADLFGQSMFLGQTRDLLPSTILPSMIFRKLVPLNPLRICIGTSDLRCPLKVDYWYSFVEVFIVGYNPLSIVINLV